jgi:hypothetical protein
MVMNRHDVSYYCCVACGSLQTEEPHWLAEAYAPGNLSKLDTGAAQRVFRSAPFVFATARLLHIRKALDFGGGDGLLVRLLRDEGIDAYLSDSYSIPTYAAGFTSDPAPEFDLITAFEVFEHLPNPKDVLTSLFACKPKYLLCSTELYNRQGQDWWYLVFSSGQHVFFYSYRALEIVAECHGYTLTQLPGMFLFSLRPLSRFVRRTLSIMGKPLPAAMWRAYMAYNLRWDHVGKDFELMSKNDALTS